jgi:hypothetical protein
MHLNWRYLSVNPVIGGWEIPSPATDSPRLGRPNMIPWTKEG